MSEYNPCPETQSLYVQGRLDESTRAQYELWLLDHPETVAEIEQDLLLREAAVAVFNVPTASNRVFERAGFMLVGALAAALIMLLFNPDQARVEANVPIVVLSHDRSTSTDAEVLRLDGRNSQVIFVAQLPQKTDLSYQVHLIRKSDAGTLLTVHDLKPVGLGDLQVAIPTKHLASGEYWLKIQQQDQFIDQMSFVIETE